MQRNCDGDNDDEIDDEDSLEKFLMLSPIISLLRSSMNETAVPLSAVAHHHCDHKALARERAAATAAKAVIDSFKEQKQNQHSRPKQ
jgi:hypothetical protein